MRKGDSMEMKKTRCARASSGGVPIALATKWGFGGGNKETDRKMLLIHGSIGVKDLYVGPLRLANY